MEFWYLSGPSATCSACEPRSDTQGGSGPTSAQQPCGLAYSAYTTVLEYATGMYVWWHQAAGSTISGPKLGKSLSSDLPVPMSLVRTIAVKRKRLMFWTLLNRTCMFINCFEGQAFQVTRLGASQRHAEASERNA
jgi:hypothetical protein